MHEMNKLRSLSLFVGTGQCNATCSHCAGKIHRKYAPKEDGIINEELISKTIRECYVRGARSLSISSSGEPTLSPISVSKTLELVNQFKKEGFEYSPINLYSNGIRIGEDKDFCDNYLDLWKNFGLTTIYITVHDNNLENNARIYGVRKYPRLEDVVSRIHDANLNVRANLVISRENISNLEKFVSIVEDLIAMKVDYISAWPIRNKDDKIDSELALPEKELKRISYWIETQDYKSKINLLGEKDRVLYETSQKLTLFPDNTLSNSWCNH